MQGGGGGVGGISVSLFLFATALKCSHGDHFQRERKHFREGISALEGCVLKQTIMAES